MSAARCAAWLALYLGAGFSLLVECGLLGRARAPALDVLPARLGPLAVLEELEFDPSALGAQPPERYTFRRVRADDGSEGRLFIAYYARAQRWSGRPHDVERCFEAAGWEERDAHRLAEAHRPWSRRFERETEAPSLERETEPRSLEVPAEAPDAPEAIRVVHWNERPGPDGDRLAPAELVARLGSGRGFRPDVCSVYFELPAEVALDDGDWCRAVAALSAALDAGWE